MGRYDKELLTPEEVAERIRAYGTAGIEEFMVQWGGLDDIEGLQALAARAAAALTLEGHADQG